MYYDEELGREPTTTEVVCGIVLAVVVVGTAWAFLEWACE